MLAFLASTRLPVVARLGAWLDGCALAGAGACGAVAIGSLAFAAGGYWSPSLPLSGAVPALAAMPWFLLAWWARRRDRVQRAATLLLCAMALLGALASWPRGMLDAAWYAQPAIAAVAGLALGVAPGLMLAVGSAAALLLAGRFAPIPPALAAAEPLFASHSLALAAVALALALVGAIANRLLYVSLLTAQAERRDALESTHALRRREKLLRHALRVDTVGELAGMVCHQLRNTFQVLMGHVTLGAIADDVERRRRLEMIEQTVEQAKPLLDQLMRLSHPDDGAVAEIDVADAVRRFVEHATHVLPSNIRLASDIAADPARATVDPQALQHALWNLAINARQAITGEGTITVRCARAAGAVVVEVGDTGCGMPDEVRRRIFDPYFTTKPPGQGTGLGLTAVARFVRGCRGEITVDSEVGRGTTFRLMLPANSERLSAYA